MEKIVILGMKLLVEWRLKNVFPKKKKKNVADIFDGWKKKLINNTIFIINRNTKLIIIKEKDSRS